MPPAPFLTPAVRIPRIVLRKIKMVAPDEIQTFELNRDTLPLAMSFATATLASRIALGSRPNPIQSKALKRSSNTLPAPINKKP